MNFPVMDHVILIECHGTDLSFVEFSHIVEKINMSPIAMSGRRVSAGKLNLPKSDFILCLSYV